MPTFYFSWISRESEQVVERIAAACETFLEGKCVLGRERDGFVPEKIKNSLARCDALFVVIGEESSASEGSGGRIVDRLLHECIRYEIVSAMNLNCLLYTSPSPRDS